MNRSSVLGTTLIAATVVGCGKSGSRDPSPVAKVDSGATAVVQTIGATVVGAEVAKPVCPVTAVWVAQIRVFKVTGALQYRWERSDTVTGPTQELKVPAKAATEPVDLTVPPYEWKDTDRGVQLDRWAKLHILSPIASLSAPIDAKSKCY